MDPDNSVVMAIERGGIWGLQGNGKNTIKNFKIKGSKESSPHGLAAVEAERKQGMPKFGKPGRVQQKCRIVEG